MLHKKTIHICCLEAVERGTKMASAPKDNRLLEMASASGLSTVRQPESGPALVKSISGAFYSVDCQVTLLLHIGLIISTTQFYC